MSMAERPNSECETQIVNMRLPPFLIGVNDNHADHFADADLTLLKKMLPDAKATTAIDPGRRRHSVRQVDSV